VILFLIAALILYVGVPAGLVLGSLVAIPVGIVCLVASLAAGGPGVAAAARLTGSPTALRRAGGWALLTVCSVVACGAGVLAVLMISVVEASLIALPHVLPFVD
jgi:hypothetical protein